MIMITFSTRVTPWNKYFCKENIFLQNLSGFQQNVLFIWSKFRIYEYILDTRWSEIKRERIWVFCIEMLVSLKGAKIKGSKYDIFGLGVYHLSDWCFPNRFAKDLPVCPMYRRSCFLQRAAYTIFSVLQLPPSFSLIVMFFL